MAWKAIGKMCLQRSMVKAFTSTNQGSGAHFLPGLSKLIPSLSCGRRQGDKNHGEGRFVIEVLWKESQVYFTLSPVSLKHNPFELSDHPHSNSHSLTSLHRYCVIACATTKRDPLATWLNSRSIPN
ncbi:hypothetical protein KSP40_PGU019784 [Platanthera guangdongensis]|uniref:Uncharacterized protein n=1 Tax=Platanthera guangdongensis TaxID=2320717 RepID=A0ABR2MLD8_9ASPA